MNLNLKYFISSPSKIESYEPDIMQTSRFSFFSIRFSLINLFLLLTLSLSAQRIKRMEYFINVDPGVGKAIPITGFANNQNVSVTVNNISVAGLPEGVHRMFVRAQSDDLNWSLTQVRTFYRTKIRIQPNITRVEYFIDEDPGIGKATNVNIPSPGTNIDQLLINVQLDEDAVGPHTLYVRSRTYDGVWSITQTRTFQQFYLKITPEITALEYFIDHDPGFGQANMLPTSGVNVKQTFAVDITTLGAGVHTLYVRARNMLMQWGLTHSITFIKSTVTADSEIKELEYFIDTDPGFGQATKVAINPGTQVTAYFPVDINSLKSGVHTLYVRSKNAHNQWGLAQHIDFMMLESQEIADINYLEYFIDEDPGFGQATSVTVTPGDHIIRTFPVDISQELPGLHRFYVRACNANGKWSITHSGSFMKVVAPEKEPIAALEWFIDTDPGMGNANQVPVSGHDVVKSFNIDFGSLERGLHNLYIRARTAKGKWSITQSETIFRMVDPNTPDILKLEYYITKYDDAGKVDPGFGRATNVPIVPGKNITQPFRVNLGGATEGWYTLNVRAMDSKLQWSITQQQHFIVSGTLSEADAIEYFIDNDPGFGKAKSVPLPSGGSKQVTINIASTEYEEGMHTLYVRARNQKGVWSITQYAPFYSVAVHQVSEVDALEFFIDIDPGFGEATPVAVTPGMNITRTFNVPLAAVDAGVHTLYVRARNTGKAWSITNSMTFNKVVATVQPDLKQLEYFIDNDPGFGKGTKVSLPSQKSANVSFMVSLNNIDAGFHTLYVRSQNADKRWGVTQSISLLVSDIPENYEISDVSALEYFIDTDPGVGEASKILLTSGKNVQKTFTVDISDLKSGMHIFYVRAINAARKWSFTHYQSFFKSELPSDYEVSELSRLEYFIDKDPGFGKAVSVPLLSSTNTGTVFNVSIGSIDDGPHTLYVRAVDKVGKWTLTHSINFYRTDIPLDVDKDIEYLEYFIDHDPGFGKGISIPITAGENVNQSVFIPLDDLWPGPHTLYIRARDARKFWSLTQDISLMVIDNPRLGGYPDIVALEYFFDEDPGFGQATHVEVTNPGLNVNQRFFIELDDIPEGLHTLYVRGMNSQKQWSVTHNISVFNTGIPKFEDIKSVVAFEYFIDNDPGFGKAQRVVALSPDQRVEQTITVNVDTLSEGLHRVYVRALDNNDEWSHTQSQTFMRIEVKPLSPVTAIEYFIDKDPGFGKASKISVTPGTNVTRSFNISLPDTLSEGIHELYVRSKNQDEVWSITHSIPFKTLVIRKVPGLAALEYFIDKDPGFGQATPMPVPYGNLDADVSMVVPLTNIIEGVHTLYVRAKNTDNAWGITQDFEFVSINAVRDVKIMALEYFIDHDPGFGQATRVTGFVPATTVSKVFAVNFGSALAGMHTLYVRAIDENNIWSITQDITFIRLEDIHDTKIVKAEYYIDSLTEFGSGIDIPVTANATIQKTVAVNTTSLSDGIHTIFVRVKDDQGAWSITQYQQFVKQSKYVASETTAMEWFINDDPGFGQANAVAVTSASVNIPINISTLEPGIYTLYIRARNKDKSWGITQDFTFIKMAEEKMPNIVAYEWFIDTDPGFGKAPSFTTVTPAEQITKTVAVNISGMKEGIHTMYVRVLDDNDTWSITQSQTFLKTAKVTRPDLEAMEYFIDTDPGFGQATRVPLSGKEDSHVFIIDVSGITDGLHTLYVRALDKARNWSITQNVTFNRYEDTRDIADITAIEWFIDTDPGFGQAPVSQSYSYSPPRRTVIQTFQVDISHLTEGGHIFFARARNEDDVWSITQYQPFVIAKSRKVNALEYFIDEDKGFGKNIQVPVTPGEDVDVNFNVSTSGLDDGIHQLYVRALNETGAWSITQNLTFVTVTPSDAADVEYVEYFIDNDPGFGKAINAGPVTAGSKIKMNFWVDIDLLDPGVHTLYVRSRNSARKWSITHSIEFMKVSLEDVIVPEIALIEYFFDKDPGFGNGTQISVKGKGTHVQETFTVQLPANTLPGVHTFYVRALDTLGRWSHTQYNQFIKIEERELPDVVALEYFIDKDPGFGKAVRKMVTAPGTSVSQSINVGVDTVPAGLHTLYVRALDTDDKWSITHSIDFMKIDIDQTPTDVTAIEWFIDTDPGFGEANPAPAFTAADQVVRTFAIPLSGIDDGTHHLYVRARDSKNNWSITQYQPFVKSSVRIVPKVIAVEYFLDNDPGFGKGKRLDISPASYEYTASFMVPANMLTPGTHTLYVRTQDSDEKWSITQDISIIVLDMDVLTPSNTMALEYFFDTDPGFGKAKKINISPSATSAERKFFISVDQLSEGPHTLYVRALNEKKQWSITHSYNIVKIGAITTLPDVVRIEYFFDKDPGFGKGKQVAVSPDKNIDKVFDVDVTGVVDPNLPVGDYEEHTIYIRAISSTGRWAITHSYNLKITNMPEIDPSEKPDGGSITPADSKICQGVSVTLRAQDYQKKIVNWQSRVTDENGITSAWQTITGSANKTTMIFTPTPGKWEYRLVVVVGDSKPEYSKLATITVLSAAKGGFVTANTPEYVCSSKEFELILEDYKGDIVMWQERNSTETTDWTDIQETNDTITVIPPTGGSWQYRAKVAMGECSDAYSKAVTINVISATTGGKIDPATLTSCVGKTFELKVGGYLGKVIGWQVSNDKGATWNDIAHTDDIYITTQPAIGEVWYRSVVKAGNCDNTYSEPSIVTVLNKIDAAGEIEGEGIVCVPGTRVRYSIKAIPYVDFYEWTLPSGATFDGDPDKNEIWVNYARTAQSGAIIVKGMSNLCGAGDESNKPIEVREKPVTPVISGPSSICIGQQVTYEVPDIPGATYTWSLPIGWIGSSTSRTITVTPLGVTGTVSVTVTHPVTGCTSDVGELTVILSTGAETGPIYRLPNKF